MRFSPAGIALAILALSGVASEARAQAWLYDGRWGIADAPECLTNNGLTSSCPALEISGGQFRGEESVCDMTLTGNVPGMDTAQVFDLVCQGEGDAWEFRALFHRDLDGRLTVLNEYGPIMYLPLEAAPGGAAPAPVK